MIELPFPAKVLWPNGRTRSPRYKAAEARKHKDWAWAAAKAAGVGKTRPERPIAWSVTVYPKTRHKIDRDNALASLKSYQDGIALAMGVDDSLFCTPMLHFGEPVKGGKIIIVMDEAA